MTTFNNVVVASLCLVGGALFAASPAYAGGAGSPPVSWNYLEAGYAYQNVQNADDTAVGDLSALDDGNGAAFELSFSPYNHVHVGADLTWTELDVEDDGESSSGPDLMKAFVGVGGHYTVLRSTDVYLDAGFAYEGLDSGCCGLGDDDNGGAVRTGVRSLVLPSLELGARAAYTNVGGDSVGAGRLIGRWYFSNVIALALNLEYDSDEVFTLFSGLRLDFGRNN